MWDNNRMYRIALLALFSVPVTVTILAFVSLASTEANSFQTISVGPTPSPDPEGLIELGLEAVSAEEFAEAEQYFRAALEIAQTSAELYNELGFVLSRQAKPEAAIEAFAQAVQHAPQMDNAHFNLAREQHYVGEWESAEANYLAAIALNPQGLYFHELGNLYIDQGETEKAEEAYWRAIAQNPNSVESHINLSTLYANDEAFEAAIVNLNYALEINPTHALARANLASLYLHRGQTELAQAEWRELIRLNPESDAAQLAKTQLELIEDD